MPDPYQAKTPAVALLPAYVGSTGNAYSNFPTRLSCPLGPFPSSQKGWRGCRRGSGILLRTNLGRVGLLRPSRPLASNQEDVAEPRSNALLPPWATVVGASPLLSSDDPVWGGGGAPRCALEEASLLPPLPAGGIGVDRLSIPLRRLLLRDYGRRRSSRPNTSCSRP